MMIDKNIIASAREYALSEMQEYGLPSVINFALSETKAKEFAQKLGADIDIVLVGAYLMDIKLGQSFVENRLSEHVAMGIDATNVFLDQYDIDQLTKDKIINCVAAHHKHIPYICLEAEICANADCYRFVHPKGFFAYLHSMGKKDFADALAQAELKMDEKHNIISLDICREELEPYYKTLKAYIADIRNI